MPKMRHLSRRLGEHFGQSVTDSPLWMLDAQHLEAESLSRFATREFTLDNLRSALGVQDAPQALTIVQGGVAVIPIVGMIVTRESWLTQNGYATAQQAVQRQYESAIASDQVKGIAFYIDSPGGMAQGNEEASLAMFAARGKKPTVAYVEGMMCSAAYYLGSVADSIVASPSSLVGSIGSILVHFEVTKLLEEIGYTATVIRNPAKKALGGQFEKLGADGRQAWQNKIDALTSMFESAVARHRGLAPAQVREKYGQGEAFFASEALSRGLIDQVGSFAEATATLASKTKTIVSQAQPAPIPAPSPTSIPSSQERTMDPRLKAALFARGLIASLEASDAECTAALKCFYAGRGVEPPTDPAQALAGVLAAAPTASAPSPTVAPAPASPPAAANVQAAHDREIAEARRAERAATTERFTELKARGELLGMSGQQVEEAFKAGMTVPEALEHWVGAMAAANRPITPITSVPGGHGGENFMADAGDALLARCRLELPEPRRNSRGVQTLRNARLDQLAAQCLTLRGERVDPYGDREDIVARAMAMDGVDRVSLSGGPGGPGNRPGGFPDLLSSLANKLLDQGLMLADSTYEQYTGEFLGELPDFKAAPIVNAAGPDELQEVLDDEAAKELTAAQECISQIFIRRYGGVQALTVVMVANDDLDVWATRMMDVSRAWDNTVNRLCLRQATGNVTLLDGNAFYDNTNRTNDVSSGAAPSDSQWDVMQLKIRSMRGINNENYLRQRLDRMLIPPALERGALQIFAPFAGMAEMKVPVTDATLNVYRGRVQIIVEPELQASSSVIWYGFCNPQIAAAIKRAYFRGWGKSGKRQRWYKPETKTTYYELEGRVGVAVSQPRNSVRNAGQ